MRSVILAALLCASVFADAKSAFMLSKAGCSSEPLFDDGDISGYKCEGKLYLLIDNADKLEFINIKRLEDQNVFDKQLFYFELGRAER